MPAVLHEDGTRTRRGGGESGARTCRRPHTRGRVDRSWGLRLHRHQPDPASWVRRHRIRRLRHHAVHLRRPSCRHGDSLWRQLDSGHCAGDRSAGNRRRSDRGTFRRGRTSLTENGRRPDARNDRRAGRLRRSSADSMSMRSGRGFRSSSTHTTTCSRRSRSSALRGACGRES